MFRFKRQGVVPPGGRYFFEIEGTPFIHPTRIGFFQQLRLFFSQNGRVVPDNLEAITEDYMCRRLPPGFCEGDSDGKPIVLALTLRRIREITVAFLSGAGYATPGVAKERAVICSRCPGNDRTACPTCVGLIAWGERQTGGRSVKGYSDILGVCELDGCLMSAGVFASEVVRPEGAPEHCWRGKL